MLQHIVLLLVGFVILVKGADVFVESACNVAQILRIPLVIIGIVIIGFGTSLPEFAINLNAVLKGQNAIAIGNIIGSNVFNILFIIGAIALFRNIHIKKKMLKFEFPFLIGASALLVFFSLDSLFIATKNTLSRLDGIILLLIFASFLYGVFYVSMKRKHDPDEHMHLDLSTREELKIGGNLLSVITGIILVIYGGDLVVDQSVIVAQKLGLSQHFIGLTIVAIGSSLPELVTSIIALFKRQQDIIVGNILGSNIFNILCILGMSSVIMPLALTNQMIIDAGVCLGSALLLAFIAYYKKKVTRTSGILFIALYVSYLAYILISH